MEITVKLTLFFNIKASNSISIPSTIWFTTASCVGYESTLDQCTLTRRINNTGYSCGLSSLLGKAVCYTGSSNGKILCIHIVYAK